MWLHFIKRPPVWAGIGLVLLIVIAHTPPSFVRETVVVIPSGSSFSVAADTLHERHVITSSRLLRTCMILHGGAEKIQAGTYLFSKPLGTCAVARRLALGEYNLTPIRITFPEGTSVAGMSRILSARLPAFSADEFLLRASTSEGYLFPDTYFFLPDIDPETVFVTLRETFDERAEVVRAAAASSGRAFEDIVIMASLLEEEAQTQVDKEIVAGILWKRIDEGMALQVDAPFIYILGKASRDLNPDDLEFDSPYNTYLYRGLPPTPISNPGLESLNAALNPKETLYWFYLSSPEGVMYYAETFEGHQTNREKYL